MDACVRGPSFLGCIAIASTTPNTSPHLPNPSTTPTSPPTPASTPSSTPTPTTTITLSTTSFPIGWCPTFSRTSDPDAHHHIRYIGTIPLPLRAAGPFLPRSCATCGLWRCMLAGLGQPCDASPPTFFARREARPAAPLGLGASIHPWIHTGFDLLASLYYIIIDIDLY